MTNSQSREKITKKQVLQNFLERNYSSHLIKIQTKNIEEQLKSPSRRSDDLDNFNEECVFRPSINLKSSKMVENSR